MLYTRPHATDTISVFSHPVGNSQNFDWSTNSFIIVVYENFFKIVKVQSEFSVYTIYKLKKILADNL